MGIHSRDVELDGREELDKLTKDLDELRSAESEYKREINDMLKQKKQLTDKVRGRADGELQSSCLWSS